MLTMRRSDDEEDCEPMRGEGDMEDEFQESKSNQDYSSSNGSVYGEFDDPSLYVPVI